MSFRRLKMPLVLLLVMVALLLTLFRALTPWVAQYKGDIEARLSTMMGQTVTVDHIKTSWYWFEPVLQLDNVTIHDKNQHTVTVKQLMVGIHLLGSLWHWRMQPGLLFVDGVQLTVRQVDGRWLVDGISHDPSWMSTDPRAYLPMLTMLLSQDKIILHHVSARVYLQDGSLLPLNDLNLVAANNNQHYRLRGHTTLAQLSPTQISFMAKLQVDPANLMAAKGNIYVALDKFLPAQWQGFLPTTDYRALGGEGSLALWLNVANGQVNSLQTTLNFEHLRWSHIGQAAPRSIQAISGNVAWKRTTGGWTFSGDKLQLRAKGVSWPTNAVKVDYDSENDRYRAYIKTLLITPLRSADLPWPDKLQAMMQTWQPMGQLDDTQLQLKGGELESILCRFTDVSVHLPDQGEIQNLSGVLNWQPTEGQLELDSVQTIFSPKGLPPVTFTEINTSMDWKALNNQWRVHVDRFVLRHNDFLVSGRGVVDEPYDTEERYVQLTGEFSARHLEQWFRYIPAEYLKPKFHTWLMQDVKQVAEVSGQVIIKGALNDFPFDAAPGEFSLNTHLSGVDLFYAPHWPEAKNIDGYLQVNKRLLSAAVTHAEVGEVGVEQLQLSIKDLGLGHDTLLVHTTVETEAEKLKTFVMASPLKKNLKKLNALALEGSVSVELGLEVPLYPENDTVLAQGTLGFKDNQVAMNRDLYQIKLSHLDGTLHFDADGVQDSQLTASLLGEAITMTLQSAPAPKRETTLRAEGDTSIDLLRDTLGLPVPPFIQGHLHVTSLWTLTADPSDLDQVVLSSSLNGVSIDLPAPLGKPAGVTAPLKVTLGFNAENAMRLQFNYDNRLSSDVWLQLQKGAYLLQKGDLRLGPGQAIWQNTADLRVVGVLPTFDTKPWQQWWSERTADKAPLHLFERINVVDLRVGDLAIWNHHYKDVSIQATKLGEGDWSVLLKQQAMSGNLRYQRAMNLLSGRIAYLNLPAFTELDAQKSSLSTLTPSDIPQLNLTIDELKLGDLSIGKVEVKSTSTPTRWTLESASVTTPEYQWSFKGAWNKEGKKETTDLQANLRISSLSQTLKRWNIEPVVEASQGDVSFTGGWPGAVYQFSLARLKGQLSIQLNKGRITHLDKETEEKLGLGKLLSILSLQTIPRRLTLDFSDLAKNGYSFDTFKGNFSLNNGIMTTKDSTIDGPVAYASMKGDLNVVKRLYDIDLHVAPHITASLPIVVATIAGSPIAGVATWAASKIINRGMQKISGYSYKISGPWLTPVVQQVNIYKIPLLNQN